MASSAPRPLYDVTRMGPESSLTMKRRLTVYIGPTDLTGLANYTGPADYTRLADYTGHYNVRYYGIYLIQYNMLWYFLLCLLSIIKTRCVRACLGNSQIPHFILLLLLFIRSKLIDLRDKSLVIVRNSLANQRQQVSLPGGLVQSAQVGADLRTVSPPPSLYHHLQRKINIQDSRTGGSSQLCQNTNSTVTLPNSMSSTEAKAWTRALCVTRLMRLQRLCSRTSGPAHNTRPP